MDGVVERGRGPEACPSGHRQAAVGFSAHVEGRPLVQSGAQGVSTQAFGWDPGTSKPLTPRKLLTWGGAGGPQCLTGERTGENYTPFPLRAPSCEGSKQLSQ